MTVDDLNRFKNWFQQYAQSFLTGDSRADRPIRLKIEHTFRVCENMRMLGREADLAPRHMPLAETAALFHDVGRFRQYRRYGTFLDAASENHARLGLRELARNRVLSRCATEDKRRAATAIAWHNALAVPSALSGLRRQLTLLLRDADKLDIWKVVSDYYQSNPTEKDATLELNLPDDDQCSEAALQALAGRRMVQIGDIRNLNDFKLLQIGWVYDLSFPATFRALEERGHIDRIAEALPQTETVQQAVRIAREHVRRHAHMSVPSDSA